MRKLNFLSLAVSILFIVGCAAQPASVQNQNTLTSQTTIIDVADLVATSSQMATASADETAANVASVTSSINSNNKSIMLEYDAAKHYTATLKTSAGDIVVALNFGQTPNTVKNFMDLAQKDFYNDTIFHRVMKGFMIQGGDPRGDGTGDPGYKFADEPFKGEYTRGTIAMANSGPNTNGSQFFIMHADYPLPKNYTIFGHVLKGLDVVDAIANSQVTVSDSGENSKPVTPAVVKNVVVAEVK